MGRTAEFVLGLIGGIIGFFAAGFAIAFGGLGKALQAEGASTVSTLGWVAVLFSAIGIVGAVLVYKHPRIAGTIMLVAGVGGLICIGAFYILPFVLFVIGGLMALIKKGGI